MAAAMANGGDELRSGCARERAEEGEGVEREQRARGETEGATGHIQTRRGRLGGKQEVARAASALATELLRCEGRKTTGGLAVAGWAASWSWARWAER